jgi:excisionase family DNA binding protein
MSSENLLPQGAISINRFAQYLGRHRSTAYRLVCSGKVKVLKTAGIVMIPMSEVQRYLSDTQIYQPKRRVA